MIKLAYALGCKPQEVRDMSPTELASLINTIRPKKNFGGMSEGQARSITDRINANPDKYA